MRSNFETSLEGGKVGESLIALWLMSQGYSVLPVYEKQTGDYKGPTLFQMERTLVAPDMLVMGSERTFWVEAKHKSAFSWNRTRERWTTGIDLHHYEHYMSVQESTPFPVWMYFLHKPGNEAKDTPDQLKGKSPTGLFARPLSYLSQHEDHQWTKPMRGQQHGMVYWDSNCLLWLAGYEELERLRPQQYARETKILNMLDETQECYWEFLFTQYQ